MPGGIPKSTIIFVALALVLVTGIGLSLGKLVQSSPPDASPRVDSAFTELGINFPIHRPADNKKFTAKSALVWDAASGTIKFEQNGFERTSIASLTKLMTAMVALDYGLDWDKRTTIEPKEYVYGGQLLLQPGEEVTVRDLFNTSLIGSANNATLAYVRSLGVPEAEFVQAMNRKAVELGLEQTHFVEVTGLDPDNISTAYEVARLAHHAFTNYPAIAQASAAHEYKFVIAGSGREHTIKNTNKLISEHNQEFLGSKTGYLYEANYCLVVEGLGTNAQRLAVILGSPSEAEHFQDIDRLLALPLP